jgi:hypothetical protein
VTWQNPQHDPCRPALELAEKSCGTNHQTVRPAKARYTKPALHRREGECSHFFFPEDFFYHVKVLTLGDAAICDQIFAG